MPTTLHFELSNICNLECTMCSGFFSSSIRKNRENLPALPQLYDSAFVEQLRPYLPGLNTVKFFGGEPFLIPIYHEIWDALCDLNPRAEVQITTNGTVYNEKVKRYLEKLNTYMIVSIDSFVKETYETIRINAKYERVMENLMKFSDYARSRGKHISVAVCPITTNAMEMPDMVRLCNKNKIRIFFNTVSYPLNLCIKNLPVPDIAAILLAYEQAIFDPVASADNIARENLATFESLIAQVRAWKQMAETQLDQEYVQVAVQRLQAEILHEETPDTAMAQVLFAIGKDVAQGGGKHLEPLHALHAQAESSGAYGISYLETMARLTTRSRQLPGAHNERLQQAIQQLIAYCEAGQHWEAFAEITLHTAPNALMPKILQAADLSPAEIWQAIAA
ncbi:MAG: radical SAM protein [Bacteroidetes bacterium]|nr:MAG: radical SAM protein [Bacteroidota bacterium]